ncbi:MAG: BrnA antitoxin family protein [Candidatus Thiodiazotropha sp. (ex Cardiolucina cf. quadrata)]|nr:BrnA antitoxin family protein [Candidatus Thiodiazotropha sp. (ex Cardiolucina cf. quadrata)]
MSKGNKIPGTVEAWETGELGRDEEFVEVYQPDDSAIDDALELQMISIRLQKGLIEDLKQIAQLRGLNYQPLIRQLLQRFVVSELKLLAREYMAQKSKEREEEEEAEVQMEEKNCA